MVAYVYILSDYGEDGAENVCATLDRARLVGMIKDGWPYQEPTDRELGQLPVPIGTSSLPEAAIAARIAVSETIRSRRRARHDEWIADAIDGLEELLAKPDAELAGRDGHNCQHGWGGLMLHVVELV